MKTAFIYATFVGTGGFAGAILRYALGGLVHRAAPMATFPLGTLAVNLAGCLAIGVFGGLADSRQLLGPEGRAFLLIGLLGGFTTFSSFGYETLALVRAAEYARACANVCLHVILGLGLVWLGFSLVSR